MLNITKYINTNNKKIKDNSSVLPTTSKEIKFNSNDCNINMNNTTLPKPKIYIKPNYSDRQIQLMEEGKLNQNQCLTYP